MDEKIKIAEFVTRLEFGGVEAVLLNYLGHFKNKENYDIHIVTQDINDPDCIKLFESLGYTVDILTHKRKSIAKNVRETYRLLKKEKFKVVHSHMTLTNFYVLFMAGTAGAKLRISHSHNAFTTESKLKKIVWLALKKLNQMSANVWMACGHDAAVFLYGKKAVEQQKVYIVNNAIDLKSFAFNPTVRLNIRKEYGIGNAFCVGHVGRFMEQKNHAFLLKIIAEILKLRSDAKLLLVGSGELEEKMKEEARLLAIDNSVIFTGNVRNSNDFYQAMDVFVLPSLYEGLPVVSIEAQTADLPCYISDRVDARCILTNNVHLMSIDKSPKIWAEEIIKCEGKARGTGILNKIKDKHYSIDDEAENLEKLYCSVFREA